MKKRLLLFLALLGMIAFTLRHYLFSFGLRLPRPRYRVRCERDLSMLMPDGIHLKADRFYPVGADRVPTILIRSPYGRNTASGVFGWMTEFAARRFAERGYNAVVQDVRGRFDSEGLFEPYFSERQDGIATIAWMKQQAWFNGEIGMWGPSYLGIVQWAVADQPEVKAIVPGVTSARLNEVVFPDGAFDLGLMMRWMVLLRLQDKYRTHPYRDGMRLVYDMERSTSAAYKHLPLSEADSVLTGDEIPYYRHWLKTHVEDPLWNQQLQISNYEDINAHTHLIGGWYDFFLRGLLKDYQALKAAGKKPYLTIGPWTHFSNMFLMFDLIEPAVMWFDSQLKGLPQRELPVRLYVMGANEWREYADYPPPSRETCYYLCTNKSLAQSPVQCEPDTYRYDPNNPTPIVGGAQFHILAGARDNRRLEKRSDVLTYTSAPLLYPMDVIGAVKVQLYVKSSREHTDFFGRLCDVYPDGRSINVCDGLFRIEPGNCEKMADGTLKIEIDLWGTAYRFKAGHSLRLIVSSAAHPRWNRHSNGSNPFTDTVLYPADQTVYHDPEHPSALIISVV